jgi:hypothetical protein
VQIVLETLSGGKKNHKKRLLEWLDVQAPVPESGSGVGGGEDSGEMESNASGGFFFFFSRCVIK